MVQPSANTELTIAFIRIIESVMCLLCLYSHIKTLTDEEPMPHIVLFCTTFGGFFILSLAKLVVPLSGQLSPPGVDLVFSFIGFFLFYSAACAAMFFVQRDPHLISKNGLPALVDEPTHVFFQKAVSHAILSITTGTLFLMHAVISADRLTTALRGIDEDIERKLEKNDIDIYPEDSISLHLFFLNWLILIWNTACCQSIQRLVRRCQICCIQYYRKKLRPSYIPKRRKHRRARQLGTIELERLNGITMSTIAPEEFIRNPRRSLACNNSLSFDYEDIGRSRSGEKTEQGDSIMATKFINRESGEGSYKSTTPIELQKTTRSLDKISSNTSAQRSFSRNEAFGIDNDKPKKPKIKWNLKKPLKTSDQTRFSSISPDETQAALIRNKAFEDEDDTNLKKSKTNETKNRNISFIRNKEFYRKDESKLKKIFKRSPKEKGILVQNEDKETIESLKLFSPKPFFEVPVTQNLQNIDNPTHPQLEKFTVRFDDTSLLQKKASPKQPQIPIDKYEETSQSATFDTSYPYIVPKTTLQNQKQENKDKPICCALHSTSHIKEVTDLITSSKLSEKPSENQTADDKCTCTFPVFDSTSYMRKITTLVPLNKFFESTSKCETDDAEYRTFPELDSVSYMKEVVRLIPNSRSESKPKTETKEAKNHSTFPDKENPKEDSK